MIRHHAAIILALLLTSACSRKTDVTAPTPAPATQFSLSGLVAENGSPTAIAGATVSIGDGPNAGRSTTTDDAGHYQLSDLQRSGFTVTVTASNYAPQSLGINLVSNQTLSFRLNRTTSRVPPTKFELTGIALDDASGAAAGAAVYLDFLASDVPGTYFAHASGGIDSAGAYRIAFDAVPGLMAHGMTAFACLRPQAGYAQDCQWILAVSAIANISRNFRTYRIPRLGAGESIAITIRPDESVCLNNVQDFPGLGADYVCRTVRIVSPADGVLTIDALSDTGARPPLEVERANGDDARIENPRSIAVTAGAEIVVNVEMPWGGTANESFTLSTKLEKQ